MKVYNLSVGKSIPEWLEQRKKKNNNKLSDRRHIQLIQDLEMPVVSNRVAVSPDGHYILATGTYKPRVRCFEVEQLSMKFERCFDSEAVTFEVISPDYAKMIFLQCDRHVEIHSQNGRYYRLRIPRFGRDLVYNSHHCDTYFAGDSSEIYRLNLEQGRFLQPYSIDAPGSNVCKINQEHQLISIGTVNGTVEAFDPRSRQRVGRLDCVMQSEEAEGEVTSLAYRDGLNFGVGFSNGIVMLYDLRSPKPLLIKDHMYGLPIKKMVFQKQNDYVLSMDSKAVKIWERETGKAYAAIESEPNLNDLALYPDSGLLLLANEQPKMQVHFIPSLGPAPRWCSFLDNITEELEEDDVAEIYDDYKFVSKDQLYDLGLDHLIGSPLLRAYMHGYFMDVRLYRKAMSIVGTSKKETDIVKSKIQRKLNESDSVKRVVAPGKKLPAVNKDVFLKLQDQKDRGKKKDSALLDDDRFKGLFTDERFEVDKNEEAYKLLNPVLSKLDASRAKELERKFQGEENEDLDEDEEVASSDDMEDDDSSSEDDEEMKKSIKMEFKQIQKEKREKAREEARLKFYELNSEKLNGTKRTSKKSLESRVRDEEEERMTASRDGHEMTFHKKKSFKQIKNELKNKKHRQERMQVRRSTAALKHKRKQV